MMGHAPPGPTRQCAVVIATKDRREVLERCLDALAQQTVEDLAVVVVDDGSRTPIREWLDPAARPFDLTIVTHPESLGPAAARNAGVAAADARYIVFVDDDVAPNPEFVEAHLQAVTAPHDPAHPIVSCGPFVQPADWNPTPWNLWEAAKARREADLLGSGRLAVSWRNFHTGNNCVPADIFASIGGFDDHFKRSEDDELGVRLHEAGCQFVYVPDALAWHYSHRSLESWLAIPAAYARYDVEIDRAHPGAGYLRAKQEELGRRHPALRLARWVFGGPRRSQLGIDLAVAAAQWCYRRGWVRLALAGFSVAYDLLYVRSMRAAVAAGRSC